MRSFLVVLIVAIALSTIACTDTVLTGTDAEQVFEQATQDRFTIERGVLVLVDGEALGAGRQITDLDAGQVARIEIIKGSRARALYGVAAERGAIHIYTKPASRD